MTDAELEHRQRAGSPAARQRRYRARRANGKIVVPVTVDAVHAAEELVAKGWLHPADQDDPRAIGAALERARIVIMPRETRNAAAEPDVATSLEGGTRSARTCRS